MASNVPTDVFARMSRIAPNVFLYRPDASTDASSAGNAPRLLILCSWMGARNTHIAKYLAPYQALYPSTQILVIKCEKQHFLWPASGYRQALPAVPAIRAALDSTSTAQLAVHIFSNGGSSMLRHLYRAYRETAKPGEATVLPLHTTIFDSAPAELNLTREDIGRAVKAFTTGLSFWQAWLFGSFIRLWMAIYLGVHIVTGKPNYVQRLAASHNNPKQVLEVHRTYIYSKEDDLVDCKYVEKYAADARDKGFTVRMERFHGSAHVAHARLDKERYWKIVKESWDSK